MESYHNKVNNLIKSQLSLADKKTYAGNFLAALSDFSFVTWKLSQASRGLTHAIRSDCSLISGLGIYARYLHFPEQHPVFPMDESPVICSICKHRFEHKNPDYENMTSGQEHRMRYGFHQQTEALDNYHILKFHNAMAPKHPTKQDLHWMRELLSVLAATPKTNTIKNALKSLKNTEVFQARIANMKKLAKEKALATAKLTTNTELFFERFLETLGFCGVLETKEHKGYLSGEIIPFPPRASWISDWYYPVDFWKGCDGVNQTALEYWFADFI